MTEKRCPNCDGILEVPSQKSTVVCLYCGTTIQVRTGTIIKEHYLMRVQFNEDQAAEKMLSWAMKQLGAPKDLEDKTKVESSELVLWPFWVVEVEADAKYSGWQKKPKFGPSGESPRHSTEKVSEVGQLDLEEDIIIPATKKMPETLLEYVIPTKRKEFFNKDLVHELRGSLQQAMIERDEAIKYAKRIMKEILREEASEEVDSITKLNAEFKIPAVFLVHVPVWHIRYKYSLRSYHAYVDGASGRIISMKFPRKVAFRATTMMGGLIHLVVGGGIGLFLVYLGLTIGDGLYPSIAGVVLGLGMLGFSLRFFAKAISVSAEEESAG